MPQARDSGPGEALAPERALGALFHAVQTSGLLADSKTFVDAIPKDDAAQILERFDAASLQADFDLEQFVEANFDLPMPATAGLEPDPSLPVREHIDRLWDALTRRDETGNPQSSLIELPRPYVVPGGRFREIYYWDSYFTMLGLAAAGRDRQVEDMVENFAYLIDTVGFVPNGNRSYFCSRSQPPFFALMVELLATLRDPDETFRRYLPQLAKEHAFWMLGAGGDHARRAVPVGGTVLNRYWDDTPLPRPESYAEDVRTAAAADREPAGLYRDIRAACESGWDFSARWLTDPRDFTTIRTTSILPVELNCLLHELERVLARAHAAAGDDDGSRRYTRAADERAAAIRARFFDGERGLFTDLLLSDLPFNPVETLAAAFPLFCGIADDDQAAAVAARLRRDFLANGGWLTSLTVSGQQWDAPNGWAPLQWICYRGLLRYGHADDAGAGARRWVENNLAVYRSSGRLMERYDVVDIGKTAAGGEYQVQDGFGWTNGVLLRFLDELEVRDS